MDESSIEDLLVDKVGASAQIHFKVFPKKGPLGDEQGTAYVEFDVPENSGRAGEYAKKALKELKGLRLATVSLSLLYLGLVLRNPNVSGVDTDDWTGLVF